MITSLNWPTLEQRRNYYKLVMMHKITRALAVIPSLSLTPLYSTITRGHMQRLTVPSIRVNSYLHSFSPTSTKLWNRLPEHLVGAQLLEHFRELILNIPLQFITTPTIIN